MDKYIYFYSYLATALVLRACLLPLSLRLIAVPEHPSHVRVVCRSVESLSLSFSTH
jgi:hypothetical protein